MNEFCGPIPQFKKPPVVETVLGIFFCPVEGFNIAEQGILWDRYLRTQFPKLEERPPMEELPERFSEDRILTGPIVRWRVMDRPDTPRLWATSADGHHVVQIQQNAFFSNWLKGNEDEEYRPYLKRREEFSEHLSHLDQFFRERNIGQVDPISWNVTYINHIDYSGLEKIGTEVSKILTVWTNQFSDNFLCNPDHLSFSLSFPMPVKIGRLNASLKPVILKEKRQALHLDLTARGQLKDKNIESALAAIDLGHEWVVRGFTSLTCSGMHKKWEKMQ